MKYLKLYENFYYRSDKWFDEKSTEEDLSDLSEFEKIVNDVNSRSKWRKLDTYGLSKDSCVSFYRMFKNPIEFEDGTKIDIYDAIYNLTHMMDDGGNMVDFMDWIYTMKKLEENGGVVYRLVYLTDENSFNREEPGMHWTTDKHVIIDFYDEYFQMNYAEQTKNKNPYIITAKIPPGCVKFNNLDRAREQEVTMTDQSKIEIISIERKM